MTVTWNSLVTWLDRYLAEQLGTVPGYEYAPGSPEGTGILVTVGFMPEAPANLVTITGYAFPEHETGSRTGAVVGYVQVRARATTRQDALTLAEEASRHLCDPTVTSRLDAVTRQNIQPIGQAPSGHHEATANLVVTTMERT